MLCTLKILYLDNMDNVWTLNDVFDIITYILLLLLYASLGDKQYTVNCTTQMHTFSSAVGHGTYNQEVQRSLQDRLVMSLTPDFY